MQAKPTPTRPGPGQRSRDLLRVLAALRATFPARFLIGVSGGPDSVALLDALVRLGHRPHICHFNHKLRGRASDGDARFVRQLAAKFGLSATVGAASPPRIGAGRGKDAAPTSEDAARRARFAFFERVAAETGLRTIALAHTADDQVETFLMRLIRGAGVDGLAGIWPERRLGKLRVVRPLLEVGREEALMYLRAHGLEYRVDASNADRRFLRNRIRHELLPLLERDYNPRVRDALRRTAEILRAEAAGDPVADERRAVRAMSFAQVEALRKLARKEAGPLPGAGKWKVKARGKTVITELGIALACAGLPALARDRKRQSVRKLPHSQTECFDADLLGSNLFVRTWRKGDRFQPLGMTGEKKLQDFFVDEKVPRRERARVPLLCASDGRIAWVVGHRIAEPFKVTPRTRRVWRARVERLNNPCIQL